MTVNRKWTLFIMLGMAILLLAGCNIRTVEDLYWVPERSQKYTNLQTVIDQAMGGLEYTSPQSGEHQQVVQMTDLNGDGVEEYLLFAKDSSEKPLKVLIFSGDGESYYLLDTIEINGLAFDQVEYIRMNDNAGVELVVGCRVSDQVLRSVSVYTLVNGSMECIMTDSYAKFLCADLNRNGRGEVFVLKSGQSDSGNGIAMVYTFRDGQVYRSAEAGMSAPVESIKRLMLGKLQGGEPAVFVASDVEERAIITDIYRMEEGHLKNISFSGESGDTAQTLRDYYVYADDIDEDGVLELPDLVPMRPTDDSILSEDKHLIRWYAMTADGFKIEKKYTYHNFIGGWYLELDKKIASRISVAQKGNSFEFYLWDRRFTSYEKIMTLYVLTGQKREEQAVADNRFILHRGESVIYAADLEVASLSYDISRESMISGFHMILKDWNTGET